MIIYNVTINVDESIHDEWLDWMKNHIPLVLSTGCFSEAKFSRVLVNEKTGGTTYSIQYRAHSRESLDHYYSEYAAEMRKEGPELFGDKTLAFRTELEIIDEYVVNAK